MTTMGAAERPQRRTARLFVAGNEPNSRLAREHIEKICNSGTKEGVMIEIIDILEDFQTALDYGVVVTPTLVLIEAGKRIDIIGNLSGPNERLAELALCADG